MEDLIDEAKKLAEQGVKELILGSTGNYNVWKRYLRKEVTSYSFKRIS